MATEAQKREIDEKITALVRTRFGGDYRIAFAHYDSDRNGVLGAPELKMLLADARIGNVLTRRAWAKGILSAVDTDGDGGVSWDEFQTVVRDNEPES
jgi:Ca2+-binding EF-hand superfamily protein